MHPRIHLQYAHARTTDDQWNLFSLKSRTFGLWQTNWADKFCWPNYQRPFWYNESHVQVFHYSTIISTRRYATFQTFIWDWDLNLGHKESGIYHSCVRSPCLMVSFAIKNTTHNRWFVLGERPLEIFFSIHIFHNFWLELNKL